MKYIITSLLIIICCTTATFSQSLPEARDMYLNGEYAKALPVFAREYAEKPNDATLNQWYGVCLYKTGGDIKQAEECLLFASKKGIRDSFLFLGELYSSTYRFEAANEAFDKYEAILTKRNPRKKKEEVEKDNEALEKLELIRGVSSRLHRMVSNVEDVQIIDSIVVDKSAFLSAYKLSFSGGKLKYFNQVFSTNRPVESTVYFNEKETKIYYGQPDTSRAYTLFSMEKLIDDFGNEKKLSATNFGLDGDVNYPYIMPDGVTVYFSAKDEESVGGYDLFVTRYNMNNDTYLTPERMNMPFNSVYNDYMMVVDEEKGVGWFASDRFQPNGKVCVYTFIPNESVKIVESDDDQYKIRRALITSIKDSWIDKSGYKDLVSLARKEPVAKKEVIRDFDFVINDTHTYYVLSDFKNIKARDMYFNVIQQKARLDKMTEELIAKRDLYSRASGDEKQKIANSIRSLEQQVEQLSQEIPVREIEARNEEVNTLSGK